MKKTLTVSLNGRSYELEEDAFKMLDEYLKQLESYFAEDAGKQEILSDIESRIADHFDESSRVRGVVIGAAEVRRVIEIMGTPSDIADGEKVPKAEKPHRSYRKLYRNMDDKVLGGVCSGMGCYWNVEPLLFRIIFIISIFWGGLGLLVYAILWIAVPPALTTTQKLEMRGEEVTAENIGKSFENKK